jgi:hypothetical protein
VVVHRYYRVIYEKLDSLFSLFSTANKETRTQAFSSDGVMGQSVSLGPMLKVLNDAFSQTRWLNL